MCSRFYNTDWEAEAALQIGAFESGLSGLCLRPGWVTTVLCSQARHILPTDWLIKTQRGKPGCD